MMDTLKVVFLLLKIYLEVWFALQGTYSHKNYRAEFCPHSSEQPAAPFQACYTQKKIPPLWGEHPNCFLKSPAIYTPKTSNNQAENPHGRLSTLLRN